MHGKYPLLCVLVSLVTALWIPSSHAQEISHDKTGRVGIGIQAAPFPVLGISARYNPSENLGLQVFGKTGYDVDIIAARGLYRFHNGRRHNWYGAGLIGYFRDPNVSRHLFGEEESDSAPGYGVGIGIEHFFDGTGSFGFCLELDFIHIAFDDVWFEYEYKSFSLVMLGLGIHYYL